MFDMLNSTIGRKRERIERLQQLSGIFLILTHSALRRQTLDMGGKSAIWPDVVNGEIIEREMRFNYQDPYELYMFDKLVIPRIQAVFGEATQLDAETYIRQPWSRQALYALRSGVTPHSFDEITDILASRDADLAKTRGQQIVVLPFGDFRYA
jgi:hypothetical protein